MGKPYRAEIKRTAEKEILALTPKVRRQVQETINRIIATMGEGGLPQEIKAIKGLPACYRVDSGEYRVLLQIDRSTRLITIFRIRHRKDAYRHL